MPSTVIDEPARPRLHRGRLRRPARVRFALSLLRLAILLLLAGVIAGGWYLAKKGFSRNWREKVVEELHKRGVEASVRRLTLDPFRGLIARDLRIYDYKRREKTLAVVSEVALDINYAALLHHQPFLNALDIRNADLTIPLPPSATGKSANAELKHFRAHVYFPPERIEVSQAEGFFCGIRISASGQLIKRESYRPSANDSAAERAQRLRLLQTLVTTLQKFRYPKAAPELQVKFSGDLSQLEDAHLEATLRGSEIVRGNYRAQNLFLRAEWKDHALTLPQVEWSDQAGRFAGTATWSRVNGRANFQLHSSIDLQPLLGSFGFGAALEGVTFQRPPVIDASGSASIAAPEKQIEIVGSLAAENFSYHEVGFEGLNFDFAWDGERTMLRDIRLRHRSGALNADLLDAPEDFRLNFESTIFPSALLPLAPVSLRPFLGEWEWQRSPNLHFSIRGMSRDPATWQGDGTLALGRTRYRGVWMNRATANLRFGEGAVAVNDFQIERDEGRATGSFLYDDRHHEIRLTNVQSTLRPSEVIYWVEPRFWDQVVPYRFHRPPQVAVNGLVQFRGGKQTNLEIRVEAPAGMDYTFIDKVLPFDRIAGRLLFTQDRLQIFDLNGKLFSGNLIGAADISLARNDHRYKANVTVEGIDFPSLTNLYFNYKTSQGELSGTLDFGGSDPEKKALRGAGRVEVKNGNVFAIPIFGPLSELLNKIFTGAGYSIAHQATAPLTIRDGVIHTDNLKVSGNIFAMLGHGDINFIEDQLDFDVRIDAGGPGAVLTPIYKLFEYHGSGSLKKPLWRPKRF